MSEIYYLANSALIELDSLKNEADGAYINDATVSVTLTDEDGTALTGGDSWPKTMAYVAASNGKYQATLTTGLNIVEGQTILAKIAASQGGLTGNWTLRARVVVRP